MLLAIDAGNTNVVFALFEGGVARGVWRCATNPKRTGDEYAVLLTHLMGLQGFTPRDVTEAILASVVPPATFNLKRLCRDHFGCDPMVVGDPSVDLGVQVLMDRPQEVGADRLVNAVAAADRYPPPLVVVDFGTATTFDVVDGDGNYCGGVIAPGINLSLEALHLAAAALPRVDIQQPATVIGKNTVAGMQSGIFWGYVGLIEGLLARIRREFAETAPAAEMTVIGTGGLAVLFGRATPALQHIDPDLTLHGLYLIHKRNKAS